MKQIDTLIRPEIKALAERGNITKSEMDEIPMNSYERNFCLPYLTHEAFIDYCTLCNKNTSINNEYPTTYNEAVIALLFPQLLQRFMKEVTEKSMRI